MSLVVHNLHVRRSPAFALHIPELQTEPGRLLCVTGPNGCGKTTLMECLSGLLAVGSSSLTFNGQPFATHLQAVRAIIGFVPDDEAWLVAELNADEYFGLLYKVYRKAGINSDMHARTLELARRLHFTAFRQPLGKLSHGNKKKAQLIAALMHRPRLLILDELRNGLDPMVIIAAEQLIRDELSAGTTIVAATHDLWWAERMAHSILLLVDGKPVTYNNTAVLLRQHASLEALFISVVEGLRVTR